MADWSEIEVEYIVSDYFEMLSQELKGNDFNKAQHRRDLQKILNGRSEGSIEFKHQNISAILINLGQPYIKGYLPRYNYQKLLEDKVIDYLSRNREFEKFFYNFSEKKVESVAILNYSQILVDPPKAGIINEPEVQYERKPIKINYLEREQRNHSLGQAGEKVVYDFEKWKLISAGKEKLAEQVEWVSKDQGDGAGFDILSKDEKGNDKFIEVKTTQLSKESPFYFTKGEYDFSKLKRDKYYFYRVFNFNKEPKIFTKNGSIDSICNYYPVNFKGYF